MIHEDRQENERQLSEPLLGKGKTKNGSIRASSNNDAMDESLMMF